MAGIGNYWAKKSPAPSRRGVRDSATGGGGARQKIQGTKKAPTLSCRGV